MLSIANSRLVTFDGKRVTFRWKDYRAKLDARYKLMTLDADEFLLDTRRSRLAPTVVASGDSTTTAVASEEMSFGNVCSGNLLTGRHSTPQT